MNAVRLTVTIPREEFRKIEEAKRQRHINRSVFLQEIIRFFFAREDEQDKISRYIAGYRKKPEKMEEISALTKAQMEILGGF